MPVWVGTSGWQYRDWRGRFYPERLRQADWLEHYAARFQVVEVNNAFYRLPEASTFEAWARRTPDDFVVAVKVSRYLTHVKRLKDPAEPVARFCSRAVHLGPKLGPVLLQLPPNFAVDLPALEDTLDRFPAGMRVAVELRHESWFTDDTRRLLTDRGVAFCLADSPTRRTPVWRTADWAYLRLHEGVARPHPCYGRRAIATWAARLRDLWDPAADMYVFLNNDHRACAVRDARQLALAVRRVGMEPTRVPVARDVRVA